MKIKKLATSVGRVPYVANRLRCRHCKATIVPIRAVLDLKLRQTELREFQKLACETIAEQSYRRSCKHLTQIGGIMINRMRLHRIIARAEAEHLDPHVRGQGIAYLMADGTGFPEKKPAKNRGAAADPPKEEEKIVSIFGTEKDRRSDLKIGLVLTKIKAF